MLAGSQIHGSAAQCGCTATGSGRNSIEAVAGTFQKYLPGGCTVDMPHKCTKLAVVMEIVAKHCSGYFLLRHPVEQL